MTELERIRQYFQGDRFATECTGIVIEEAYPGFSRCVLQIEPRHCNALGNPMGGAVFTLADYACAVASNCGNSEVVTQASQITFLSAAKGTTLIAKAHEVKAGRKLCFYQTDVTDELGTQVAYVTASGFVTKT